MYRKSSLATLLLITCTYFAQAQNPIPMGPYIGQEPKRSLIRSLLNKFTLSVSTGYGRTFYKHTFDGGIGLIQKGPDSLFLFDNTLNLSNDTIPTVYGGWFNDPMAFSSVVIDGDTISANGIPINPGDFLLDTDTASVKFTSRANSIPIEIMLHMNFSRYRVGIGATMEFNSFGRFTADKFTDSLQGFPSPVKKATFKRFFIMVGGILYEINHYRIAADAHFGVINLGKNWNTAVLQKGAFFNLGVNFEKDFSELFSVFLRPSFEFKSFTINIPETGISVDHNYPALFVNVGIRLRLPKLRKCPIKLCETQINHVHWGTEYRSRMHPFYKWQNPDYGENYPKPIRYKRKNRKKRNPY